MGGDGEEQDLVIGLGITKHGQLVASYSHLRDDFGGWVCDVDRGVPPHLQWFAKCWDQVLVEVLIHDRFKFILAAHECLGRVNAKQILEKLRDELLPQLTSPAEQQHSAVVKLSKRLKVITSGPKGTVPPRKVLVLYPGAPRKFLTRDDQAPEYLEQGKSRLQQELDEFDRDTFEEAGEDAFVFNVHSAKRTQSFGGSLQREDEDEDDFTFSLPPKIPPPLQQHPQQLQPWQQQQPPHRQQQQLRWLNSGKPPRHNKGPAGYPFSFILPGARGGESQGASKAPAVKMASPTMSNDFSRSGSRVSPEDHAASKKAPAPSPFVTAMHSGFGGLASRGKQLFSMQFERSGSGRAQAPSASKVRGNVGHMAPSGLKWEDEIAAQLAAAGVRVSGPEDISRGRDDRTRVLQGLAKARSMLMTRPGGSSSGAEAVPPLRRSATARHHAEKSSGFGRFARGLRRTFNRQGEL